jgi:hypothetical protein
MCCFPFSIRLCIRVSLVSSAEEADVLYLIEHTFGIDCLQEANKIGKVLNQFWWDGLIVTKESLCHSARLYKEIVQCPSVDDGFTLPWIPLSFDLSNETHLAEFILTNVFYKKFSESIALEQSEDPSARLLWIVKTFYGKQSIDYPITRSINCAIRHLEANPRLASNYIQRPVLLLDRKFDLRFYVFVKSLEVMILKTLNILNLHRNNFCYFFSH